MEQRRGLRVRSRIGKYRILRKVGEGAFASVYQAHDTIEGIDVALKIPHAPLVDRETVAELQREIRLTARLDHRNILPIKNAELIDGRFVIAHPLGVETLETRLRRRMSAKLSLDLCRQMLAAVAHAHGRRVIHCDIKPDNVILFADGRLRLGDFGIARVALRRVTLASGQGTVGYVAPEQALGKPTLRSDVFSLGLVMYRMFSGSLPEWPYKWPPPGIERARQVLRPEMLDVLRRCLQVDERRRFASASPLHAAVERLRARALRADGARATRTAARADETAGWRSVRKREFMRRYRSALEVRASCAHCAGPVSESMLFCPWCGRAQRKYAGPRRFSAVCGRCRRSAKRDWRFCGYCYGPAIQPASARRYPDRRYTTRCHRCGSQLMPFMRYCPGCRIKARRKWALPDTGARCPRCRWGVAKEFWEACPWCGRGLGGRRP